MTASEFPITFPFKGQDGTYYGPNGSVGLYHLGDDRIMPRKSDNKTPIPQTVFNGSTLIGMTGITGVTSGHHLHSGKYKLGNVAGGYFEPRYNQTYWKPVNIFNAPGKVTQAGPSGGSGGTLVRWLGDDGFYYEQFHLSSVNVKVGDRIGAIMPDDYKVNRGDIINMWHAGIQGDPPGNYIAVWINQPWKKFMYDLTGQGNWGNKFISGNPPNVIKLPKGTYVVE